MSAYPFTTECRPHPATTTMRHEVAKIGAWSLRPDEDLVAEYVEKDSREAFEDLVHRYEREMFSYLRKYLRSRTRGRRASGHTASSASEMPGLRSGPEISALALQNRHQPRDHLLRQNRRHNAVSLNGGTSEPGSSEGLKDRDILSFRNADRASSWRRPRINSESDRLSTSSRHASRGCSIW